MSFKDRVIDGVSSLFDKLSDGDQLGGVDPIGLERELSRRRAAHTKAGSPAPSKNKRAMLARAGAKALEQRARLAARRLEKIHAKRAKRAASKKRDQDAAFHHMAEEARRNPPPRTSARSSTRSGTGSRSSSRASRPSIFQNKGLAQHYKTIGVAYGSDEKVVKKAYRGLMRKYHPDLHRDPKKKKAATELTVKISAAYQAIEKSRKK